MLVKFALYPSISELEESTQTNAYAGAATEYWDSVNDLSREMNDAGIHAQPAGNTWGPFTQPASAAGNAPPTLAEFFLHVLQTTAASTAMGAVYKTLQSWLKAKAGRKIKVTYRDLRIEVTGMSVSEFELLFRTLRASAGGMELDPDNEGFEQGPHAVIGLDESLKAKGIESSNASELRGDPDLRPIVEALHKKKQPPHR